MAPTQQLLGNWRHPPKDHPVLVPRLASVLIPLAISPGNISQQINAQTIFISDSQGKAPPFLFFKAFYASVQTIQIKQTQDVLS